MICDNCGASYKLKEYYCPYCQSENPVMVEVRKEQILKGYDIEAEKMKEELQKKRLRKWRLAIVLILSVIVILAVILGISAFVLGPIIAKIEYKESTLHMERLEAYLQAEDLEGMSEYIQDHRLYSREYKKYSQVNDAYDEYDRLIKDIDFYYLYAEMAQDPFYEVTEEDLINRASSILRDGSDMVEIAKVIVNDRVILGNEEIIADYYDRTIAIFEEYGISEGELEKLARRAVYPWDEPETLELVDRLIQKLENDK